MEYTILSEKAVNDLTLRIEQIVQKSLSEKAPKTTERNSEFISRSEVAKFLRITLPTLHDWTKQGWLQSYKIGNRVLYKKQEVEQSIQQVLFHKHKKGGML